MNWDRVEGQWNQVSGLVVAQWGRLTEDDIEVVAGRRQQLAGKIQQRYGVLREEADRQIAAWEKTADDSWFSDGAKSGAMPGALSSSNSGSLPGAKPSGTPPIV